MADEERVVQVLVEVLCIGAGRQKEGRETGRCRSRSERREKDCTFDSENQEPSRKPLPRPHCLLVCSGHPAVGCPLLGETLFAASFQKSAHGKEQGFGPAAFQSPPPRSIRRRIRASCSHACPSYACSPLCPGVRCQLLPSRNHYADRLQQ